MRASTLKILGRQAISPILFLLLLTGSLHTSAPAQGSSGAYAIRNVTVIDVVSGHASPYLTVVVSGRRITKIGKNIAIPPRAHIIDGKGKFLLPGLWDMHVHTGHPSYLGMFIASGITGVRDMGGDAADANTGCESISPSILISWRREILDGRRVGPRMLISGPVVSNTGWPTSINVFTPNDARKAVRRLKALGVDFVKVYEKIPVEAYRALLREARKHGMSVAGHVPVETVSLLDVADAGQRSVEHIRDPLLMCFTDKRDELLQFFREDNWKPPDAKWGLERFEQCPDVTKAFRKNRTWLVPTLSVERSKVAVEDPLFVTDPRRDSLPSSVRAGFDQYVARKNGQTEVERASDTLWWRHQQTLVARMHSAGVGILAGTDSACEGGLPGFSLHDELALLVASGLKPIEALRTATINPAKYLRRENELGTIQAGKLADLLLLDGNPLQNISNTKKIHAVFANGRYLSRESLQSMLRPVNKDSPN